MSLRFGQIFGTFFGVGFIPVIPATWTSLVVALLYYWVPQLHNVPGQVIFAFGTLLIGIPACTALEKRYGEDPKQATMDEACGMGVALLGVDPTLMNVAVAFILFRIFDVLKPQPARKLEELPGGLGIMLDDVAAGMYTRVSMLVFVSAVAAFG
jgi:phosphatidylglycerophosphatase A